MILRLGETIGGRSKLVTGCSWCREFVPRRPGYASGTRDASAYVIIRTFFGLLLITAVHINVATREAVRLRSAEPKSSIAVPDCS